MYYSEKYYDDQYEYRYVIMPENFINQMKRNILYKGESWRTLGIQMSMGWEHYGYAPTEPYILLFRKRHNGKKPEYIY